jgi:hypothetical protein
VEVEVEVEVVVEVEVATAMEMVVEEAGEVVAEMWKRGSEKDSAHAHDENGPTTLWERGQEN